MTARIRALWLLRAISLALLALLAWPFIQMDPDNDGLPTWQERLIGTDPWNPDTDGDSLKDGWEVQGFVPAKES
jgi:hypothetical protein